MFKKILIANRGEIAVRIMRTCKEMGIRTVAIYSDIDRTSLHVLKADEAYCVGSAHSSESYLNIDAIIDVLKRSSADAIHPGYGFLSENVEFAKIVMDHNVSWIGPSLDAISSMGDKMAARDLALKANLPIVPGTKSELNNIDEAYKIAEKIGYPILIKAAGGGGGKGMRIIQSENDLEDAILVAESEAENSFSDKRVYIEKYLEEPHHIEVQVFGDSTGNIISLGERECSIQRRYQKIIEESPSPFISNDLRNKLSKAAIRIAKACNYVGAGTVEFLIDKNYNYYFLEMNTRLQVEHPITEMRTNIDLVKEQINVAFGKKLSFNNKDLKFHGYSIECRIYAEDGFNNFSPSTGIIEDMMMPNGLGVRVDEGIRVGQEITSYYDPLLGKLITWGDDRKTALNRMIRALNEFYIVGLQTNIPFCILFLQHDQFQEGNYSTETLNTIKNDLVSLDNDYTLEARISATKFLNNATKKPTIKNDTKLSNWVTIGRKEELR